MKYKVGRVWAASICLKNLLKNLKKQYTFGFFLIHKEEKEKESGACFLL